MSCCFQAHSRSNAGLRSNNSIGLTWSIRPGSPPMPWEAAAPEKSLALENGTVISSLHGPPLGDPRLSRGGRQVLQKEQQRDRGAAASAKLLVSAGLASFLLPWRHFPCSWTRFLSHEPCREEVV